MYIDKQLEFSDAQAETTVAAHDSDNILDMSVAGDAEKSLWLVIRVVEAVTSGGAGTVQFKAIHDSDSGFATTPKTFYDSGALAKATLIAGYTVVKMRLPADMQRWMKLTYTIATAALTAGSFDGYLTTDVDHKNAPYGV